jgi:hypothetical protein
MFIVIGIMLLTTACSYSVDRQDTTRTHRATESAVQPTVTMPVASNSPTPADEEIDDSMFVSEELPEIAAVLPSLEEVAQIMEMDLFEEGETYAGPALPFEHTNWAHFVDGVSTSYLGSMDEGDVGIDLGRYTNSEAAIEVYGQIRDIEFLRPENEGTVVFESIDGADAALGVVYPPSEWNEFTVTGILFRTERIVVVVTVFSLETHGHQEQARHLAEELVRRVIEFRAG